MAPASEIISKKNPCAAASKAENISTAKMSQSRPFMPSLTYSTGGQLAPRQNVVSLHVFLTGLAGYILRQRGSRGLLVPLDRFQVVANELLVVRLLRPPRLILVRGPEPRRVGCKDLVGQDQTLRCMAELKFGIRDDNAAAGGVVGRGFINADAQVTKLFRELGSHALAHVVKRNILVVPADSFGCRRKDGLRQLVRLAQTGGKLDSADRPGSLVILPSRAGEVAADYTFDIDHLRFADQHGAPA